MVGLCTHGSHDYEHDQVLVPQVCYVCMIGGQQVGQPRGRAAAVAEGDDEVIGQQQAPQPEMAKPQPRRG